MQILTIGEIMGCACDLVSKLAKWVPSVFFGSKAPAEAKVFGFVWKAEPKKDGCCGSCDDKCKESKPESGCCGGACGCGCGQSK